MEPRIDAAFSERLPAIEAGWRKKWAENKAFEADAPATRPRVQGPGSRVQGLEQDPRPKTQDPGLLKPKTSKYFITPAFPYPNSPQHIGHGRTYTTTDIYARFMRLLGKQVLFPMAFHVTGTPILAMAKRIAAKDGELLDIFDRIYGIPKELAETLTDPKELVKYFSDEIEQGMKELGLSVDWRRKFYTFDPCFNRFIEWQFHKLHEAGYVKKGSHPVPWCTACGNAVGSHDTQGDKDPEIEQVTMVKFRFRDGFLVVATYRPETIYGVTNIWFNPKAAYVRAIAGNSRRDFHPQVIDDRSCRDMLQQEHLKSQQAIAADANTNRETIYYLAEEASKRLAKQLLIKKAGNAKIKENDLALNPLTNENVPLLPAEFVEPGIGTGVVMSVPAHAPYDYLALRDLNLLQKIPPKVIISTPGYGMPAKDAVEKLGVKNQADEKAELATKEVYTAEAHQGTMLAGKYTGMPVKIAKEKVAADIIREGSGVGIYELANAPISCRCGNQVSVEIVRDQWFLDYGNPEWKALAKECLESMTLLPEKTRIDYKYTIDWLIDKACTRKHGLGTPFPYDKSQIVESLSDSTIYMAYYTISHLLSQLPEGMVGDELFDYIFLSKQKPKNNGYGKHEKLIEKMKNEFEHWYPLDSRHSAGDLIHNHLTFFIFNHAAIFPRKHWPKQIAVNGFVLMEGKKMSKSLGNILPIRKAMATYGADVVRFVIVSGAELFEDADFNMENIEGVRQRLNFLHGLISDKAGGRRENVKTAPAGAQDNSFAGKWFRSRYHRRIKNACGNYKQLAIRTICNELFYENINDLKIYLKLSPNADLSEFFELFVPAISPIMPHVAEEFWHQLGKKGFVFVAGYPKWEEAAIDESLEYGMDIANALVDDVRNILALVKVENPKKVSLFVADEWKRKVYSIVAAAKNQQESMKQCFCDAELKAKGTDTVRLVQYYLKKLNLLTRRLLSAKEELAMLESLKDYLTTEFGFTVEIAMETKSQNPKAKNAMPMRPSIFIE
ncbi:leucine--tRNA ligase [Candidatus Micrarchaeota archaeon CG_4_10_14_0_2_um_filter_49_7]|nr:MAG: leucine--tRNA ligase [Candidatus Micrarchaeota archaeon CG_4_10_14_0_2_um_filter_49_7]